MKGTFFQRPLEFRLSVEGESWSQGDPIAGSLTVKNHGPGAIALEGVQVHLAWADFKKVREKSPQAFELLSSVPLKEAGELAAGAERSLDWKFQTEKNSPVTDTRASLYLLYGKGAATEQLGQLAVNLMPHELIRDFVKEVTTQFRFPLKAVKESKGRVEAKFEPPSSQAFATLENLYIYFRFAEGDSLEVSYRFAVKKIEASAASIEVGKKKKDLTQVFGPADYRTSFGRVNAERFEAAIGEALSLVEKKVIF